MEESFIVNSDKKPKIKFFLLIFIIIIGLFLGGLFYYYYFIFSKQSISPTTLTLALPEGFKEKEAFKSAFEDFQKANPTKSFWRENPKISLNIEERKFENYEENLKKELEKGEGPDIFLARGNFSFYLKDYIEPFPTQIISERQFKKTFVPLAQKELIFEEKIWGVPVQIQNLGLFYNPKIFEKNKAVPPQYWDEIIEVVKKISQTEGEKVNFSALAMGTAENTHNSVAIFYALLLQNGAKIIENDEAVFCQSIKIGDKEYFPGPSALDFYTSFANPRKETYNFTSSLSSSLELFQKGKTAMLINFPYIISFLEKEGIDFKTAPFPQIKNNQKVNYGYTWSLFVKKGASPLAFRFAYFLAKKENFQKILEKNPWTLSARYDLKERTQENILLKPFSDQLLATTTFLQKNPLLLEKLFKDMIQLSRTEKSREKICKEFSEKTKNLYEKRD